MPFCQQDMKPLFSQYLCGGTPSGASADNNYIVHFFLLSHLPSGVNIGIKLR